MIKVLLFALRAAHQLRFLACLIFRLTLSHSFEARSRPHYITHFSLHRHGAMMVAQQEQHNLLDNEHTVW